MLKPELLKMKAEPKGNALEIYIYSEVCPDDVDWWSGDTIPSETSAATIRDSISDHPECSEIVVYINSCGGSVQEGYGISSQLKRFDGPVTAYVDGFANSIASVIAMAADTVKMYQNSVMMIHNVSTACWGNANQLRAEADALDRIMEGNRKDYLRHAKGKLDEATLIRLLDAETTLTAQMAFDLGLCDEIIDADADMEEASAMIQREKKRYQQSRHASGLYQLAYPKEEPSQVGTENNEADEDKVLQLLQNFF